MGVHRTCGEPNEIKKILTQKHLPLFFVLQADASSAVEKLAWELPAGTALRTVQLHPNGV